MGSGTELGRVRGLGSAKEGAHHWWLQRVTAGANLFLMLWLMVSVARLPGYDYAGVRSWLSSGWAAVPMALLVVSVFYHFRLGLQVLIEDYLHGEQRVAALLLLNFFVVALGATALFAIVKVALGAA
ncbi:succinate dehydrogenase / fumarate reductase membrane anchor subunit [Sphingomonas jinjuensis]|uniref:Succinate dehydrogenase hydrophobic membrane anchor subunit n=1 Tax=Sphingomonas jinjuensis TaxID=535907 RepID=A0A840FBH8_9SPHN|nr:succinate dehydrogenase, hydrophobic membrane anchor protein [Sphingomonas jinjuensis]MBB4155009.1 succinate dehydrogenase / fumarate reductase membrane anchor subunit [Sphingomonas jinjuensis]